MEINELLENTNVIYRLICLAQNEMGHINLNFEDNIIVLEDIDHDVILTLNLKEEKLSKSFELDSKNCENKLELISIVEDYLRYVEEKILEDEEDDWDDL